MMPLALLLIHGTLVPEPAREALKAAYEAPAGERRALLESAARVLHRETNLDCTDVRELVGLDP
jgi:hypothetical protein